MSNVHGGNYPTLNFKLPAGWVVVKQKGGITTIKPTHKACKEGK